MKKQKNVKHRQGDSQSIETDQQMTQMTELADRNVKITIVSMLRKLQEKMYIVSEKMGEFREYIKTVKQNQVEMLRLKKYNL